MIIGLVGKAGSGKSTVSHYICGHFNFKRIGFADEIKRTLYKMGLFSWDSLWHTKTPESRQAMQEFGEWVRKYDFGYWTDACEEAVGEMQSKNIDDIVIDDVRRIDEADMIRRHDGILVRIFRDEVDPVTDYDHISETEMDLLICDYVIRNTGTHQDLHEKVKSVLDHLKKRGK